MAVTFGFYNSINGDRRYDAKQMSSLFDGLITDGIYQAIGDAFIVKAVSNNTVSVGTGRAWFNKTWTLNDAILPVVLDPPEVLLPRIDAVILEVDSSSSRVNAIKVLRGTASSSPVRPSLIRTNDKNQYALAYITRRPNATAILQTDIVNQVGLGDTPFVTGIIQQFRIDELMSQWSAKWNQWFDETTDSSDGQIANYLSAKQSEYQTWFDNLTATLEGNVAANLAAKILRVEAVLDGLAVDRSIYHDLADFNGQAITDSAGNNILGKIVFQAL